jgi:hypothetical protein
MFADPDIQLNKFDCKPQRFGGDKNQMGRLALATLGAALVACLVFSAAKEVSIVCVLSETRGQEPTKILIPSNSQTQDRKYVAYSPTVDAQRMVKQHDIFAVVPKFELQLAEKQVRSSCCKQKEGGVQ